MGSLESGKLANMIIVDEDPMIVPREQLKDIKVQAVIFDGTVVRGEV